MWISIRSSSGPDMRFWYFVTMPAEQVQGLVGLPKNPQGQSYTQSWLFLMEDHESNRKELF